MAIALGIADREQERGWPPLSRDDASAVLPRFGLKPAAQPLAWLSERPFSSAGKIRLADGRLLFLKRHDQQLRSADALLAEHHFITHLAAQGMPVSLPLKTPEGQSVVSHQGGVFELFPPLNGDDLYRDTASWEPYQKPEHAASAGAMLARLHQASQDYHAPPRDDLLTSALHPLLTDNLAHSLTHWVQRQAGLESLLPSSWLEELLPLITPFHDHLKTLRSYLTPLWGHGDWHSSNLIWRDNQVIGCFDFGMSNQTSAEFDIAVGIERNFIRWVAPSQDVPIDFYQLEQFLEGYGQHAPRRPARLALIASLLPLCHVMFALSEVAYYGRLLHNDDGVKAAYHGYLMGHARWFHSTAGQGLLYGIAPYA